jgi:mRNA interferase MazF
MVTAYCPDSGDVIWLDFLDPVGNEQGGRRPALVLSPRSFNQLTGRCMACPITSHDRDWALEVAIPKGYDIIGVVQTDQLTQSFMGATRGSIYLQGCSRAA